jgi:hypothetical protein
LSACCSPDKIFRRRVRPGAGYALTGQSFSFSSGLVL